MMNQLTRLFQGHDWEFHAPLETFLHPVPMMIMPPITLMSLQMGLFVNSPRKGGFPQKCHHRWYAFLSMSSCFFSSSSWSLLCCSFSISLTTENGWSNHASLVALQTFLNGWSIPEGSPRSEGSVQTGKAKGGAGAMFATRIQRMLPVKPKDVWESVIVKWACPSNVTSVFLFVGVQLQLFVTKLPKIDTPMRRSMCCPKGG